MFFIVGCGRSGTTLLQSSLVAHPDVAIPPETKFYEAYPSRQWRFGDPAREGSFRACAMRIWRDQRRRGVETDRDRFLALAEAAPRSWDGLFLVLLAAYADAHNVSRVGEKSPVHTYHVDYLCRAFPEARFIHILRDPRGVVLSRREAGFAPTFIGLHIARWHDAVEMHRRNVDLLGTRRYLLLKYEALVTDLEVTIRRVCDFLGLEFSLGMLEPHKRRDHAFAERSRSWMENTLRPVFTSSVERWREQMPRSHIAITEHALREDMELMGYEPIGAKTCAPRLRKELSHLAGLIEQRTHRGIRGLMRGLARRNTSMP